jgi:small subunit ribosomal protein S8
VSLTDPVADYLTRIRNAIRAQHDIVEVPSSKLKREITRILAEQGYIEAWETEPPGPEHPYELLRIQLKYTEDRRPVLSGLERVSRPGQRHYVPASRIPKVLGGMGTAIISTSQGVMTGHDARRRGIGGEVVAKVW